MIDFRTAIRDALDQELARDDQVVLFGEDVAFAGGVFQATAGLLERHGDRVFDTPISELALAGAAFGAAVAGMRPVVEIMFGDFMTLVMDSLVNQAAKYWSLSNGQRSVPMVVRTTVGAGGRFGAIHSQNPANWLMSVPGLKLVAPAFPKDAGGLLVSSIRDDDPVLFLEHKRLYSVKGERSIEPAPLGKASIVKEGGDLTLVSVMVGVHHSLAAAESLREEGIGVEVVDLRTLRPWDVDTVLASVDKTKRLVVVDEGPRTGGWPADVLATVAEADLSGIVTMRRVTAPDEPLPYSPPLEDAFLPNPTTIAEAVREALGAEARSAR
jgi:pyruvate/2-oxoglutarate/acetoin dehydrogenase E1 component